MKLKEILKVKFSSTVGEGGGEANILHGVSSRISSSFAITTSYYSFFFFFPFNRNFRPKTRKFDEPTNFSIARGQFPRPVSQGRFLKIIVNCIHGARLTAVLEGRLIRTLTGRLPFQRLRSTKFDVTEFTLRAIVSRLNDLSVKIPLNEKRVKE